MIPLPTLSDNRAALAAGLDAAPTDQVVNFLRGLGMGQLKAMWALAEADRQPLPISHLVGEDGEVIIHEGQNSLPVFTRFQKRFVARGGGVQGYNHNPGSIAWFTGPGHFTARVNTPDELVVDYEVMPADVPPEFPALIDNAGGSRKLVFGGMQDHLLRVSQRVTIGRAFKNGKFQPAWFSLCRIGDLPGDAGAGD
jgi:hypothetical protein